MVLRDVNIFLFYFMKYFWLFVVVFIFYLGGIGVGFLSNVVLLKEVDFWWWMLGFKEWFGGFFRVVGIVSDVGDECECEWEIGSFFGMFWLGDKLLLIGGCLKNDGGSFFNCIGNDCDDVGLGCVFVIVFLLMIWKSVFRLLLEFCFMCII